MRSPEITSFNNGVIEWIDGETSVFVLCVNGKRVSDGDDGFYRKNSYKIAEPDADAVVEISVVDGDGSMSTTPLFYDAEARSLAFLPLKAEAIGEKLRWNAVGGAAYYKVYDLDYNAVTVDGTEYDMSGKNLAVCVCPIVKTASGVLPAQPDISEIKYLEGRGTSAEPYSIRTAFELRAVDYYEMRREKTREKNHYELACDIDYIDVAAVESESNIFTLRKPFTGELDGKNRRLYGIRVGYDGGYWALFDFIAEGGRVSDIIIENADVVNRTQNRIQPINASTAMIAYVNNGEIKGITLRSVRITASGGGVAGICVHNGGTVCECSVDCTLVQSAAELGSASYEMSGIVLENKNGGTVRANKCVCATVRGTGGNIRSAAGIVSVNRPGGTVSGNEFLNVNISNVSVESEYGGIVAYNAGQVKENIAVGTLTVDGAYITAFIGQNGRGRLVGKNDGIVEEEA